MSTRMKYLVLIAQYREEDEKTIQDLVNDIERSIKTKHGEIKQVYRGSNKKIISSLESLLPSTDIV